MKYKFLIQKNEKNDELIIKEMSELEKGFFDITYEETFKIGDIYNAIDQGDNYIVQAIRTKRFFHNTNASLLIASGIKKFLSDDNNKDSVEVVFDDFDDIIIEETEAEVTDDEDIELDDILDDDKDDGIVKSDDDGVVESDKDDGIVKSDDDGVVESDKDDGVVKLDDDGIVKSDDDGVVESDDDGVVEPDDDKDID